MPASVDPSRIVIHARSTLHPIDAHAPIEATIEGDPERPGTWQAADLVVDLGALRTGNRLLDREARRRAGEAITASLVRVVDVVDDEATVEGTVRFAGVDELLEGTVRVARAGDRVAVTGTAEVDVRWWGFEPPRLLLLEVDPLVTVELEAWFPAQIST